MKKHSAFVGTLLGLVMAPGAWSIDFQTIDVSSAIGHSGSFVDGYIRGNGSDSIDPTNVNGSLSWTYISNLPFSQPDVGQYFSGTATWDVFTVTGNSVDVGFFDFAGTTVQPGISFSVTESPGFAQTINFSLDGTMNGAFTLNYQSGPNNAQVSLGASGGFIINDPGFGIETATADQFPLLGPFAQGAADYLNFVRDNHLPADWTSAGVWFFSGQYSPANTTGTLAPFLHGGNFQGYNVWFSTDAFIYGQPLTDANMDGLFSIDEVNDLIANDEFPEIAGLNLAGEEFAQIYEVELVEGDGGIQTIIFEYDESLLAPGEEALLSIVHFVDGAWETPAQVLDIDLNQITVTIDNFSPFALVTVPLPPAALLLLPALAVLRASGTRRRRAA